MRRQIIAIVFLAALLLSACAPTPLPAAMPTNAWDSFLTHQPQSYGTPLAPAETSALDGIYGRMLDVPPEWWRCLRCADYRVVGGFWRLQFDKGVMRIWYEMNGWRSISSFLVEGDTLVLFNDSTCSEPGEYRWHLDNRNLTLVPIGTDACQYGLRARNISAGDWQLCPQDRNAPDAPLGCSDRKSFEPLTNAGLPVTVTERQGDARHTGEPLSLIAAANPQNVASPDGVEITYHPASIEYGVNRVLWWNGPWIQVTTSLPYTAMGVQFFGTSSIGWASIFFDGTEIWRGDVAKVWDHFGSYGGYIEISGYEPGQHTLRVELVEGDYRPLTIAMFGFQK